MFLLNFLYSFQACYGRFENLQTHARRKGHPILGREDARWAALEGNDGSDQEKKIRKAPRRILPRPSPMHLSAAIALSELGGQQQQQHMQQQQEQQQTQQQTSGKRKRSPSPTLQTVPHLLQQPQQQHPLQILTLSQPPAPASAPIPAVGSSTQTSPRYWLQEAAVGGEDVAVGTADDEMEMGSASASASDPMMASSSLLVAAAAPRLGDVEQFSTETQTQEVGLFTAETQTETATAEVSVLLSGGVGFTVAETQTGLASPPPRLGVRDGSGDGQSSSSGEGTTSLLVDLGTKHMETQFDLDDILCSNYTQTGGVGGVGVGRVAGMSSSILPLDAASSALSCSIETQTIDSMFEEDSGEEEEIGGVRSTSHSHTQT